jgi:D-galactarolactone cycloisomerase
MGCGILTRELRECGNKESLTLSVRLFMHRLWPRTAATGAVGRQAHGPLPPEQNLLKLHDRVSTPVVVASAQLRVWRGRFFAVVRSTDGAQGVAVGNERLALLGAFATQRVVPFFVGQDARDVERLVDEVARHANNYKIAGVALWSCVAAVEMAIFDLLGKTAGKSVGELLGESPGEVQRTNVAVYLSSMRRETTPEEEVARLTQRLVETGARAVKLKIGGRQGAFDASPGRTEKLVAVARRTLGEKMTIMVDGNGSYTVEQAIEIGRMLESQGVHYFEEPCPWEDFEATKAVADSLDRVQVAGGEQDSSIEKLRWMANNRAVDVLTPDLVSSGGFVRTLRVLRMAVEAGLNVAIHSPKNDAQAAAMLNMASAFTALDGPQEFLADAPRRESWYAPNFAVQNGVVAVPTGPGLGMTIDPWVLRRARRVRG